MEAKLLRISKRNKGAIFVAFAFFLLLHFSRTKTPASGNLEKNFDVSQLEYFDSADANSLRDAWVDGDEPGERSLKTANYTGPLCSDYPLSLIGDLSKSPTFMREQSWQQIMTDNARFSSNGHFTPKNCRAQHKVAVIIPLRGREYQLRILLSHMLPIWRRQQIEFHVYTITQAGSHIFNRAKLLNVGVAEANKDRNYDCYVFHDVDLLLEDDRCLYWCHKENPRHLSMYMDKFSYQPLTYRTLCNPFSIIKKFPYFGGVSMLSKRQFLDTNGFSNLFWGWGAEDDDMYFRLLSKGYSMTNPYDKKCSFKMILHDHEYSNSDNKGRYSLLSHSLSRMGNEGFRSLKYKTISKENKVVYTNITVDIGQPTQKMMDFMSREIPWIFKCWAKMPWQ